MLAGLRLLVQTLDDAEAFNSRKLKIENHIEAHIYQLSASN